MEDFTKNLLEAFEKYIKDSNFEEEFKDHIVNCYDGDIYSTTNSFYIDTDRFFDYIFSALEEYADRNTEKVGIRWI
jgi:hypothetical protein